MATSISLCETTGASGSLVVWFGSVASYELFWHSLHEFTWWIFLMENPKSGSSNTQTCFDLQHFLASGKRKGERN